MHTSQYLHELWSVLWLQLLLKQTLQIHVIAQCPCRRPHFYSSASRQCPPKLGNFPLKIVTSLFPLSFTKLGNCTQSLFIALRRCWSLCYHFLAEKSKFLKKVRFKSQILFDAIESRKLGKLLFEMCWFYMGIAQIALDPCVKGANVEKKVPQTILASPFTPRQRGKNVPQTLLASPYTPGQCGKKMP